MVIVMLSRAPALQACAAAVLLLTFAHFLLGQPWHSYPLPKQSAAQFADALRNVTLDLEILKQLGFEPPFKLNYRRYCILAHENNQLHRESVIRLPDQLPAGSVGISVNRDLVPDGDDGALLPPCQATVSLDVPEFSSRARSSTDCLMLGVATTLSRIEDSLPTFSRWLSRTGSLMVVLLVDQQNLDDNAKEIERVEVLAVQLGIALVLVPYHPTFDFDSEGLRNFGLATVLHQQRRPETKWFGIIDDDTFFLSLTRMLDALEPFDPDEQWYIGALTEGHTRVAQEGFKAWGGAGFFISPPLMQVLAENAGDCTHLDKFFGDILWRDCIMSVTSPTVHLTEMRGLNQMDLWKDVSGWYEAGWTHLLTIHHWKSWHYFPVQMSHLITEAAGPDSMLQRYQFENNTVLTNGYSLVEYPMGIPDLQLVELTMTEDVGVTRPPEVLEFHHSLGRTRPALEKGHEKISWTFEHAVITAHGIVRQFYVKRPSADSKHDVSVIEIDWRHV